ncbi:S24/S26 family peptidase [Microbacterium sp. KSW2-21]|uniref:S24/S26 family peptidase n=1 Tax=Microbacterium algihabitans TaxID=3075992 RepID=A0ABU3RYM4_9MICO|nr:S24/S26 family peptidase [Microbacterium sp. KSW2-21]MDU0327548.1 S24/S26 family peptidase [Microbacterium sp. KSW2-21]
MPASRVLLVAAVAAARAVVTLALALGFWAAAPVALGWLPTTVMTASMTPAIEVGDVVVSRPMPPDALLPGRVVLADDPDWSDRLRLHRIAGIDVDGALITKGDANPSADSSPLHPDAVRGVGVLRVPWVGLPVVWVKTADVVPLGAVTVGFALCLLLALRRGDDDDPRPPADPDEPHRSLPVTRRSLRAQRRRAPARVRIGRAFGLASSLAVTAALGATPAWAALADVTAAPGSIVAATLSPPTRLGCVNDGGAVVTWAYDGSEPRGFDLLVNGRVVASGIPPWARAARVPNDGSYSLFRTDRVTVRTTAGQAWSAESSASVPVGGVFLGFGRPFCR